MADAVIGAFVQAAVSAQRVITRSGPAPALDLGNPEERRKRRIIAGAATAVILVSVGSLFFTQREGATKKADLNPFLAVGQVMADETAKLVGDKGEIVIVAFDRTQQHRLPGQAVYLEGFQKDLSRHGGIAIAATETIAAEHLGGQRGMEPEFPSAVFLAILGKYPKASAIVSFAGPPLLTDEELSALTPNGPKVVVLSPAGTGVRRLMEGGVVQLAFVSRRGPGAAATSTPSTARGWFDRSYTVVTTETASSLPF